MSVINAGNVQATLGVPEPQLSENLRRVFARLVDPNEDPLFVQNYVAAIRRTLSDDVDNQVPRHPPFTQSCLNAGMVKTLVAVLRQEWSSAHTPKIRYIAQYYASQALSYTLETGSVEERQRELNAMLQEGLFELCLRDLNHRLCTMSLVAVNMLSSLATEACLAETTSASTAADVIEAVCLYVLRGPEHITVQLLDPPTAWQTQIFAERGYKSMPKDPARWAPVLYGTAQESAIWAAQNILCSSPPRPRKFVLDILKRKPRVVDLLFDCAILERPAWYPETQVDSTACETLTLLFQWPSEFVPGVETMRVDRTRRAQEWKAMSQALTILTSRKGWAERLSEVWMRIDEEDMTKVQSQLNGQGKDKFALLNQHEVYRYRGTHHNAIPESAPLDRDFPTGKSRSTVLRLITTLTHAAESCGITNAQIESFLHIAYLGCRKVRPLEECNTNANVPLTVEHWEEMNRPPLWTTLANVPAEVVPVAPENALGPTALIRLYVILAQRKALDGIRALKKPPAGLMPFTSLSHIQQITHPDVVRRAIGVAQVRLLARLEYGRKTLAGRSSSDYLSSALAAFTSAGELAAALVAMDVYTDGVYKEEVRGARKQLVIAMGNASQMALNLRQYQRALHFAWAAVEAAENIPVDEGLDADVIKKNKRRVDHANIGIKQRGQPRRSDA
ncbi:hypothetical protein CONPUDRAFT_152292 [Coniophora puteana RWD-64-598 SS2]|uniref:Uncharacterized protein n=1 Tax=Coniophora puteana (strain RWD-64-598) TaxID=741705 RepID=A0A5M3MVW6_CONPW|nr:uncharacterized protein CONPUDRAFT_152292 [Coniophora puteana RWD-64-598 SS2]EIW83266.1 hypothetical protein CONPUDRAFT_152292 [Coniophora puteana RWD-64-598 SS2]